jgi:hypothetical protein
MENRSEADLSALLETVQQITKTYAQSVPKPEDIARITQAYAQLYPNAQNTVVATQAYQGYAVTVSDVDAATSAFSVPTPEQIAQIREAAARLVPEETLQAANQTAAHASPEAEELIRTVMSALQSSGASSVQQAGEPAADALIALQHALEGKPAPAKAALDASVPGEPQAKSIWKAVYIALGIMIAVGLLLTLLVPELGLAVKELFR